MKYPSIIKTFAFILVFSPFVMADHHSSNEHRSYSKYVTYSQIGNPADVLEVKTEASRTLNKGEVRVQVLAAPINPSDVLQIAGNYGVDAILPARPGSEGVGRVKEISSGVKTLKVGQLVLLASGSTWAEEQVGPAEGFLPLPDLGPISAGVIEQLAMSAVNPLTALLMLNSFEGIEEGQWIAQSAANSAVGGYVIQLAKQRGIKTVNIVRREEQASILRGLGAKYICNSSSESFMSDLTNAIYETGATLAFDATGGGNLASQILTAMEGAAARTPGAYSIYGSIKHKQVYLYGGLDVSPSVLSRGYGMAWGVGGWLLPNFLAKIGMEAGNKLRMRVASELKTTFKSIYKNEISLSDALESNNVARYFAKKTGEKFLICPQL